jgi:hypothetical protein
MKFRLRFSFFCIAFLLFGLSSNAQVNMLATQDLSTMSVDEISDIDIKNYFVKASESGINEENMFRILMEKGLPETEAIKLKERFLKLGINTKDQLTKDKAQLKSQSADGRTYDKDAYVVPVNCFWIRVI